MKLGATASQEVSSVAKRRAARVDYFGSILYITQGGGGVKVAVNNQREAAKVLKG